MDIFGETLVYEDIVVDVTQPSEEEKDIALELEHLYWILILLVIIIIGILLAWLLNMLDGILKLL
jgi:hypothetical protein